MDNQELYNSLFDYLDGEIYWKPQERRGFNKSGQKAGTLNKGYLWVRSSLLPKSNVGVHRIIWEMHYGSIPEDMVVDHINIDPTDNRIENLRLLSKAENCANTVGKSTKKSGLPKNVYKCAAKGKFRFQAVRNGFTFKSTGLTLEEAIDASEAFIAEEGLFIKEQDLSSNIIPIDATHVNASGQYVKQNGKFWNVFVDNVWKTMSGEPVGLEEL